MKSKQTKVVLNAFNYEDGKRQDVATVIGKQKDVHGTFVITPEYIRWIPSWSVLVEFANGHQCWMGLDTLEQMALRNFNPRSIPTIRR